MQHYREDQWQRYVLGETEEDVAVSMEDHLYICDDCMAVYLSLMETASLMDSINPPLDFTNKVLEQLELNTISKKEKALKNRNILLKYYVVAASITMLLMYAGFFNILTNQVPHVTSEVVNSTKRIEEMMPLDLSQRLMDITLETLHLTTIKQGSGVNEN